MEIKRADAGRGVGWYADGWAIVKDQPGLWVLLVLVYLAVAIVLGIIPFIGQPIFSLISPALSAGAFLAAREAGADRPIDVKILFQPLLDGRTRGALLTLGAVGIAFSLLLITLLVGMIGGGAGMEGLPGDDPELLQAAMMRLGLSGLLLLLMLSLLFAMAMLYAPALVLFQGQSPFAAMELSLRAGLRNWLPLTVFGLILLPLALLASIPFLLGWLFLAPVLLAALYASYRDMFGADEGGSRPSSPPGRLEL